MTTTMGMLRTMNSYNRRWLGYAATTGSVGTLLRRDPRFATLNDKDISFFRSVVGEAGMIEADDSADGTTSLDAYNKDWTGSYAGASKLCLRPSTTAEVSQIMKHCHSRRLAVVPQGGNTGLVGGSVPAFDEIVLSLSRMRRVLAFDTVSGILSCEAGAVLGELDKFLADEHGHMMPIDLAASGSCQIGGNVSTNAGGVRFVRYGSLRGSIVGIRAVLADGTIIDEMRGLRKDNTGYHLPSLFVGAEGTLGIVTAVALAVPQKPPATNLAFLVCDSFSAVCDVLRAARSDLGEIVSAVEFLDAKCVDLAVSTMPDTLRHPMPELASSSSLEDKKHFYLLIETSGSRDDHDKEKLDAFLESVMASSSSSSLVLDGVVAQDKAQAQAIWAVREMQAVAHAQFAKEGNAYFYDISAATSALYELVERTKRQFSDFPHVHVLGFGHLGDGNLHLNIVSETQDNRILPRLEPFLFELTAEFGGSISAEHGLGRMKAGDIGYSKNASSVAVMRALKSTFDPLGILNPYKFLPSTNQEKKTLPTNDTKAPREIEFEDKHRSKWDIWAAAR